MTVLGRQRRQPTDFWPLQLSRKTVMPMIRTSARQLVAVLVVLALGSCGQPDSTVSGDDCAPSTPASVQPEGDPDRRIEDIIEYLTGERQTDDVPVEEKIDDPNFGGVWGDFEDGVVVAVLDCSEVDANHLAEMAGGSDYLHLIEVPYTFRQTEEFRDSLHQDLQELGIEGDVAVQSTVTGRKIEVHVLNEAAIPESFGSGVPDDAYEIVETETVGTAEG